MTTPAAVEFESTEGMTDVCRTALRHLLVACADTKLLLGYHYGEWTFGPPELEAAIASCSLCQTELGHVRLLHMVLERHFGDDAERLVAERPAAAFANVAYLDRPLPDWAAYVAANFVVDLAVTRLLHVMQGSAFKPLRMSLDKMMDEERYHAHHGRGWFCTLAVRDDAARAAVRRRAEEAFRAVAEWFGPADEPGDRALVEAGVKATSNAEVLEDLRADVAAAAREAGLPLELQAPASFEGWNGATRRVRPGGPDDEILYHLRGSKNEIFKLS